MPHVLSAIQRAQEVCLLICRVVSAFILSEELRRPLLFGELNGAHINGLRLIPVQMSGEPEGMESIIYIFYMSKREYHST